MLENVSSCLARIETIKSRFGDARVGGAVSIAPHYTADPATRPSSESGTVEPFFPEYLLKDVEKTGVRERVKGSVESASAYDGMIEAAAAKHGLDPALLKAVIQAESGFRHDAVSRAGARGLMQLMPATAASLGVGDPLDPAQNIDGGARYLKLQLDRFGDVRQALAAYNAGPNAVVKYGGVPPFREPQNYVNKVMSYMADFSR